MNKGFLYTIGIGILLLGLMAASLIPLFSGDEDPEPEGFDDIPRLEADNSFDLEDLFTANGPGEVDKTTSSPYDAEFYTELSDTVDLLSVRETNKTIKERDSLNNLIARMQDSLRQVQAAPSQTTPKRQSYRATRNTAQRTSPRTTAKPLPEPEPESPLDGFEVVQSVDARNTNALPNSSKISAQVYGDHMNVRNGSRVRFITNETATLHGRTIPQNTVFFGTARLNNTRMDILVNQISTPDGLVNASFYVYDMYESRGFLIVGQTEENIAKNAQRQAANDVTVDLPLNLGRISKDAFQRKFNETGVTILNNKPIYIKPEL